MPITYNANFHGLLLTSLSLEGIGAFCYQQFWFAMESCPRCTAGKPNH